MICLGTVSSGLHVMPLIESFINLGTNESQAEDNIVLTSFLK